MNIEKIIRPNILQLSPYSCARDEFKGEASVYLDANESPYNNPYNRYPDPLQLALKEKIAKIKSVRSSQIMIGNGSDEPIDLVYRIFCEPQQDNVVAIDPSYGMYQVSADINHVEYRKVLLNSDFSMDAGRLLQAADAHTKVIFLCSPNNPSGNLMQRTEIVHILHNFQGIVVMDEAYIDFSSEPSWLEELDHYPNLIVLQTFSKAWGLASVRCGLAFASEAIMAFFNKVKYPYNINLLTQNFVNARLDKEDDKNAWVKAILAERQPLADALNTLDVVEEVYPSDANFLLVRVKDANGIYSDLVSQGVIVRNRNRISLCGNCLRITVGTKEENQALINAITDIS
ncbi:MAG: Histidinol-phosphate aminotransferase [Candidatus Ordinivivax streblomastigis]|uniref:Histidinol-phosphate aminotransferase n=1 Tax=Candidatus Ordinivivax streblomastigis TaxID=2540710 RepID=A0A5M8P3N3_9BACT|nr:MAG: Histidinol-phosphate aminotransferase [Candidatus Ordinivivax streblomastigis]